jgi:DNA-binding MarR family transcriptional regulator
VLDAREESNDCARLMGKASIDWDHLDADDHENLEKLTAPYWAIDEARGKGQGEIGRPALRVLEAFFVITLRRPGESLCLSQEAIAEAALLSPRTVGRAVRRLAGLGLITIHRRHKSDSVFEITPLGEAAR